MDAEVALTLTHDARDVLYDLIGSFEQQDDVIRSLRLANGKMREALKAVRDWLGLDGDGITDPVRSRVDAALYTPDDGLLDGLRKAREHHNDDCLFCAVKDTAIDALLGRKP
ncbi:MAG: hypothetical protein LLG08_00570 [Actinomycetia bacterium]|nr:hypothetical protein [Actinomycetes bacterium]